MDRDGTDPSTIRKTFSLLNERYSEVYNVHQQAVSECEKALIILGNEGVISDMNLISSLSADQKRLVQARTIVGYGARSIVSKSLESSKCIIDYWIEAGKSGESCLGLIEEGDATTDMIDTVESMAYKQIEQVGNLIDTLDMDVENLKFSIQVARAVIEKGSVEEIQKDKGFLLNLAHMCPSIDE